MRVVWARGRRGRHCGLTTASASPPEGAMDLSVLRALGFCARVDSKQQRAVKSHPGVGGSFLSVVNLL